MTMTKRQAASKLREAARYIEKNGWITGKLYASPEDNCAVCAVGAISAVCGVRNGVGFTITERITRAVERISGLSYTYTTNDLAPLAYYNDHVATGPKDVTRLLRKTARELEHGGEL